MSKFILLLEALSARSVVVSEPIQVGDEWVYSIDLATIPKDININDYLDNDNNVPS